jgi:hypothetical protein
MVEENERVAGNQCFSNGKKMKGCCFLLLWCFSNGRGKTKQVLDGVVSGIRMVGNWRTGMFLEMGRNEKY